jgi:chaperonin cofactor prefoldin
MSRFLSAALFLLSLSLTPAEAQEDLARKVDTLEFRVSALERQMTAVQDSSNQITRMSFQLDQIRGDFNEYISAQKEIQDRQNNRLWQFFIAPIVVGIIQMWLLPRLVQRRVEHHDEKK